MKEFSIDINCDVGEGIGNESELLPLISSCNIACGGHAGDISSITEVVKLAKLHKVKIGAHPSYPDKANFGREIMNIPYSKLKESLKDQLKTFEDALEQEKAKFSHIKAHGALYNQTAKDSELAFHYLEAIQQYRDSISLYVPYGSEIAKQALDAGFKIMYEAFGDRNYTDNLSLVSRKHDNALIQNPQKVLKHILPIIKEGKVITNGGRKIEIHAETICIHGDTSSALEILMYLSNELPNHSVQLQK